MDKANPKVNLAVCDLSELFNLLKLNYKIGLKFFVLKKTMSLYDCSEECFRREDGQAVYYNPGESVRYVQIRKVCLSKDVKLTLPSATNFILDREYLRSIMLWDVCQL